MKHYNVNHMGFGGHEGIMKPNLIRVILGWSLGHNMQMQQKQITTNVHMKTLSKKVASRKDPEFKLETIMAWSENLLMTAGDWSYTTLS